MKQQFVHWLLAALLVLPRSAAAHGGEALTSETVWAAWNLTPEISGLVTLTLAIYLRGAYRRRRTSFGRQTIRHMLFLAGLLAIFLSLQSPIDPLGERLFIAHQFQHFLLRMVGPMLIVLSYPEGILIAGLPRQIRRQIVGPLLANRLLTNLFLALSKPWSAFTLFLLSLYFWQIPPVHNAALRDPVIHYTMHATMLIAGLIFFAMILSRRDTAAARGHGLRVFLLFATIVSNILLGALTTLKEIVLYTAYDIDGRLFGIAPLADETGGGIIIWVPSSMMIIITVLLTMNGWNAAEERRLERRYEWSGSNTAALEFPETAMELRLKVAGPNRRLAQSLALVSLTMFAIAIATVTALVTLW